MTYRTRTLLAASIGLVLVAALGLYAFLGVHAKDEQDERLRTLAQLVFDLDATAVTRLELKRGGERCVLVRCAVDEQQMTTWRMIEPVRDWADGVSVNALLSVLRHMDAERRLDMAKVDSLATYGLDPPRASWTLVTRGGEKLGLLVGKNSPFNDQLYLKVDGADEVLLVKGVWETSLLKTTYDLRRKQVLIFEPARIRGLVLKGRQSIELKRQAGRWRLVAPVEDRADDAEVERILHVLRNLRAVSFPAAGSSPRELGLDAARMKVILRSGPRAERYEVWFGNGSGPESRDKVYAKRVEPPGAPVEIRASQLGVLDKTTFDLQDKALLTFERSAVARIKSAAKQELIVLEKKLVHDEGPTPAGARPTRWSLVSPRVAPAESHQVASLLIALGELKASGFVGRPEALELERFGLDAPARTIALFDENGKQLGKLQIGRATGSGTYASGSERLEICLVDSQTLERLSVSLQRLGGNGATAAGSLPEAGGQERAPAGGRSETQKNP